MSIDIKKYDRTKERNDIDISGLQVSFFSFQDHQREILQDIFIKARTLIPKWIEYINVRNDPEDGSNYCSILPRLPYRYATIYIHPSFFSSTMSSEEMFWSIIHELLHIHVWQTTFSMKNLIDSYFADNESAKTMMAKTAMDAEESVVCDLTRAFKDFSESLTVEKAED